MNRPHNQYINHMQVMLKAKSPHRSPHRSPSGCSTENLNLEEVANLYPMHVNAVGKMMSDNKTNSFELFAAAA